MAKGALLHDGLRSDLLLLGTGAVTTIPLLFFASAVQRIPLSLLGVLQYIAPTMQFLLGVLLYREPFTPAQFVGFAMVWAALIVLGIEGFGAPPRTSVGCSRRNAGLTRSDVPLRRGQ